MGAWSYCRCGRAQGMPTIIDAIRGNQECYHCGNRKDISQTEREDAAVRFVELIQALEEEVAALKRKQDEL